jgi:DNA-3-methyladenine glycosylase
LSKRPPFAPAPVPASINLLADRPLPRSFFARSPEIVAPELLGHNLVRQLGRRIVRARIVEVEAYLGQGDLAAHAARGRTPRNAVLFGPPGHAYVYLIYGIHQCLNVSTEPAGRAGCVLIRALEAATAIAGEARPAAAPFMQLSAGARAQAGMLSGPGRLTRALAISRSMNGRDLTRKGTLFIAAGDHPPACIVVTRRIGIRHSAELPQRYYIEGSAAVTRPRGPVIRTIER